MGKKEEIPSLEGYTLEKKTVSILLANILAIVLFLVYGGICFVAYIMLWSSNFQMNSNIVLLAIAFIVGLVVHELIHGITWLLLTRTKFSHLSFGFMTGAVYCHYDMPMRKSHYVIGALTPLFFLGLLPTVVALCVGSLWWLIFGIIFTVSAIGDIMIVWVIRKELFTAMVYDHPSEAGCYVYHKNEDTPKTT